MKIYSEMQVGTATFFASPIAGAILMSHNAKAAGHRNRKGLFYGVSVAALAVMLAIGYFIPDQVSRFVNFAVPFAAGWAYRFWYRKEQGELLSNKYPEAIRASWWSAIGISLLVTAVFLVTAFGIIYFAAGHGVGKNGP